MTIKWIMSLIWLFACSTEARAATITFTVPERLYQYRVQQLCEKSAIRIVFKMAGMTYQCQGDTNQEKLRSALDQLTKLVTGGEVNSLAQSGIGVQIDE